MSIRRPIGMIAGIVIAMAAVATAALAASPSPSIGPSASAPPASPTTTGTTCSLPPDLMPPPHQPAPPAHFDASVIPWTGDDWGYEEDGTVDGQGAWIGRLNGSGFRQVSEDGLDALRVTSAGTGVAVRRGALVVIGADGTERTLIPKGVAARFALDTDGESAFVWRWRSDDPSSDVGDIWRVPLDGTPAEVMLRSVPGLSGLVVSPDERAVAVGWRFSDGGPGRKLMRVVGHAPKRQLGELVLGFDWTGHLLIGDSGRFFRIDPGTGRMTRLPRGIPDSDQLLVTPSGRYLVGYGIFGSTEETDSKAVVRDLVDGDLQTWRLPTDTDWYLSDLSTDRYVLLWRDSGDPDRTITVTEWAVIDLVEGWLGFIPFCPPAGLRPWPAPG
ncbi:MAG: hypothetical protein U0869_15345 [Chloroflexota bacterium]